MKCLSLIFAMVLLQFTHRIAYADELSIRDSIREQVRIAFLNEDFGKLEELAHSYRKEDPRTPSGAQKINLFDDGLKLAMSVPLAEGEKYSVKMEEKALKWIDAYPNSPLAHLAYVQALSMHAGFLEAKDMLIRFQKMLGNLFTTIKI